MTNDAWAPLRAPRRLALARGELSAAAGRTANGHGSRVGRASGTARSRFAGRRTGAQSQVQGRWSLSAPVFRAGPEGSSGAVERRRALAELLLERYGIVTREQVLAEGIKGGFAMLYETFANLETLGVCRRGYFIEGMGGAQFALPGAVERLRASRSSIGHERGRTLVIAAADPAQPYGAALPWPKREGSERRPARVAGAYVVLVEDQPVLYVERGGRGLITLTAALALPGAAPGPSCDREAGPLREALQELAEAVRAGRVGKLALERIDGEPAIGSQWETLLADFGFRAGPRRLTLSA